MSFAALKWKIPQGAQVRYCVKLGIAAAVAYALTIGERADYALFSVLGAALVVGGSVGEDLSASFNRVLGTLLGAVVGAVIAFPLGLSVWSVGLSVAVLGWLCAGFGWGASAMRVGIAMALVVLFAHVADAAEYGGWRLLNTLMGVVIGVAISLAVWPVRGRDAIAAAVDEGLASIADILAALGRGTTSAELTRLQVRVLDAVVAIRTARKNARVERHVDGGIDLLTEQALPTIRAAIASLEASAILDELALLGAPAGPLETARRLALALSVLASGNPLAEAVEETGALYERAARETGRTDLDIETMELLSGLLGELRRVGVALGDVRSCRGS